MIKKFDVGERQIYFKKYDKFKDILERNLNIPYKKVKKGLGIAIVSSLLTIQGCYVLNGFFERCFEKKINLEKRVEQTKLNNEPKLKSIKKIKPPKSGEKFALPEHVEKSIDYWASMYGYDSKLVESSVYQESGGDMYRVSPTGAVCVTQLMPGTASQVGLDVPHYPFFKEGKYYDCKCHKEEDKDPYCKKAYLRCDIENDQRFDLNYCIRGGIKYKQFLERLPYIKNDTRKMLAAYNWGPANLDESCKNKKSKPYTNLSYGECNIPQETKNYVNNVLYIYNYKKTRH